MQNIELILTLTGALGAALVAGYVTQRLGLSPIVGYLIAGVAVGDNTPFFVADHELASQLAEVGVILLMFGVGLHFHFKELLAVRKIAVPGAIGQILAATALGAVAARVFGSSWETGVVFGLAISVASTVVLTRVLADNHDLHTPVGHIAVGWLVVEDLFTVVVLVVMPVLFGGRPAAAGQLALALAVAGLKICALVAFTFVVGGRAIPWLLDFVARTRSRELFTLTILVVALGIAVGSTELFGVSMALGAFLAGMVVGRSEFSVRAASEALPMRDAFAVLFFVSVGMLFNPRQLLDAPGLVLTTAAIVTIGKPVAALVIVLLLRYPVRTALAVAVALAQIGEFSFILASLGARLGLIDESLTNSLVASAILSISINPVLYRVVRPFETWASRRPKLWRLLSYRVRPPLGDAQAPEEEAIVDAAHRAVIVGYGPVGRTLARLLLENEVEPIIVEMNLDTVRRIKQSGRQAVYGDASHRETLEAAGVARAANLVLSASGMQSSSEVIRLARDLNPTIRILVRSAYLHDSGVLQKSGADAVFSEEGEIALAMTESVLQQLGATAEQVDRERARLRADLSDSSMDRMESAERLDAPAS